MYGGCRCVFTLTRGTLDVFVACSEDLNFCCISTLNIYIIIPTSIIVSLVRSMSSLACDIRVFLHKMYELKQPFLNHNKPR